MIRSPESINITVQHQVSPQGLLNDIPLWLAVAAHTGTSMVPERRGEQVRNEYAQELAADYETLLRVSQVDPSILNEEFARYRAGYRARYSKYLSSQSRCLSVMIAGPSNFPGRRNQKRNDVAHNRLQELIDYRERALKAIRREIRPGDRPIMAGDDNATERLAEKIANAEAKQKAMKVINAAHAKYLKDPSSLDNTTLSETIKEKIRKYVPRYSWEPHPFAPYEMTNNNANIRRMKERLKDVGQAKTEAPTTKEAGGIRLEDSPADNRVRLFFPGKPSEEVRTNLKRHGFRWTPTLGCWQAYRNWNSLTFVKEFMKEKEQVS